MARRPRSSTTGLFDLGIDLYSANKLRKMGSEFDSLRRSQELHTAVTLRAISGIAELQIATMHGINELIFTQANKLAFEKAHPRYRREKAIETAQPEWLEREVGFRTSTRRYGAVHRTGVLDADYMVDAGGFEPPAPWLQTRCSSKLS